MLNSGEASSGSQSSLQIMEKTGEASLEVMKLITALMMSFLRQKIEGKEEELPEETEKTIDELCAETFKKAVDEYGDRLESGATCYNAEDYIVSTNLDDPTGMPVYSVVSKESGEVVFSFQEHPKDGFVFFETATELTDEQKHGVLQAFWNQMEKSSSERSGVSKVIDDLDRMGGLAPEGSKAAIVADRLLGDNSKVSGQRYNFTRSEDGKINVSSASGEQIYSMTPDGRVHTFTDDHGHKKNFGRMFDALQKAEKSPQKSQAKSAKSKSQQEQGER